MLNHGLGNIYMCKLFPELLVDNARDWFDSFPIGSIRSYNELMDSFLRSFSQRGEVKHTPTHLLTVKQSRGESIQDFMTRFDRECLQTRGLNDLLVISAFQNVILSDALHKEILAKEPQTTTELWAIADKFAKIDEAAQRRREGDRGEAGNKKKKEEQPRKSVMDRIQRGPLESRLGPRQNPAPPPRSQFTPQFTPLTKPRSEILKLNANLFEKPRPMRESVKQRPRDKYCNFHEDFGHETEECRNLMNDIEGLVRSGPLRRYQDRGGRVNQFEVNQFDAP